MRIINATTFVLFFSIVRPYLLLRVVALACVLSNVTVCRAEFLHGWGVFGLLFLAPDAALLSVLGGPKQMATTVYNLCHWLAVPATLLFKSWSMGWLRVKQVALSRLH